MVDIDFQPVPLPKENFADLQSLKTEEEDMK